MDRRELNKMFDGLTPDPKRERELLRQLLRDNARRKQPMKNWKRVVIGVAAAALLVTGAAAAVVLPRIDPKMLDHLNVDPENSQAVAVAENLLFPGAMAVDITKEDNGAALHVTQILRDRASIMVLAEFTAPEGTSLRLGDPDTEKLLTGSEGFYGGGEHCFMDEAGEKIDLGIYRNYIYQWEILEDDAPADNRLSAIFAINLPQGGVIDGKAASMRVPVGALSYSALDEETGKPCHVQVYSGDWSFEVPLPQRDIGWSQRIDDPVGELDGARITVKELYLSPVNLLITLGREGGTAFSKGGADFEEEMRWLSLLNTEDITITDRDGGVVTLSSGTALAGGLIGDEESTHSYRLAEITDPAKLQGGSITLNLSCGTVTIPLDNLTPVEP